MADIGKTIEDLRQFVEERSLGSDCGVILGSGLGAFADTLKDANAISYSDIPHFPVSTVAGHAGRLVFGTRGRTRVAAAMGRFHYYEGHSALTTTLPVFLMHCLGVRAVIVTNAAGGLNPSLSTGDLVILRDHINFMGTNPLRELDDHSDRRFVDMSAPYDSRLRAVARELRGERAREGVLMAFPGPSYETSSEVAMARTLGADLAGMSTVPEVVVARYLGLRVLGISFVSNVHSVDRPVSVDHQEVLRATEEKRKEFTLFLSRLIEELENRNELVQEREVLENNR